MQLDNIIKKKYTFKKSEIGTYKVFDDDWDIFCWGNSKIKCGNRCVINCHSGCIIEGGNDCQIIITGENLIKLNNGSIVICKLEKCNLIYKFLKKDENYYILFIPEFNLNSFKWINTYTNNKWKSMNMDKYNELYGFVHNELDSATLF